MFRHMVLPRSGSKGRKMTKSCSIEKYRKCSVCNNDDTSVAKFTEQR